MNSTFNGCINLGNVAILNGVTNIGDYAFSSCTSLTNITIPSSVTYIGNYDFDGCASLANVAIPNGVIDIMEFAFANCTNLKSVAMPDTVTSIAAFAFWNCYSLTNVILPNGIANISIGAFNDCRSLASIIIPKSVTGIGDEMFLNCTGLTGIYFTGNAPQTGSDTFDGDNLDNITVYHLSGTTGWDTTFQGVPTAPWLPQMQTTSASLGLQANQFGFNIAWASGQTVIVEACTNLSTPTWQPVQTNTLMTSPAPFSDPQWTNYPNRFYRLRSP